MLSAALNASQRFYLKRKPHTGSFPSLEHHLLSPVTTGTSPLGHHLCCMVKQIEESPRHVNFTDQKSSTNSRLFYWNRRPGILQQERRPGSSSQYHERGAYRGAAKGDQLWESGLLDSNNHCMDPASHAPAFSYPVQPKMLWLITSYQLCT